MYLDEFVVGAGVIVSALESLNEKVRDVKFDNLNAASSYCTNRMFDCIC